METVTGQENDEKSVSDHEIESRLRDEGKQPFFRDEDAVLYVRRGELCGESAL